MNGQQRSIPHGVDAIPIEGRDLKMAVAGAAEALGLHPQQVDYKLDMSHFRSATGTSVARSTVKILAWGSDRPAPEEGSDEPLENGKMEAPAEGEEQEEPKRKRRKRTKSTDEPEPKEKSRGADVDGKPDQLRGAEDGETEASTFAQQWFADLLELMDVEGKITGTGNAERVHLAIDAERAGRIVGKRGATLGAIRHLLGLALANKFGDLTVDVDVGDDRPTERKPRREKSGGGRGRDRDRDRDRRSRDRAKGRYPEEKLRALARRGAEKAVETGRTITIDLELNSYDRRVVHVEISEIDGVESQSEEREQDGRVTKYVQIIPL